MDVDSWPLVWLAEGELKCMQFEHVLSISLPIPVEPTLGGPTGYGSTTIAGSASQGRIGIQWNWVECEGVVAMEDPMRLLSNAILRPPDLHRSSRLLFLYLLGFVNGMYWQQHACAALIHFPSCTSWPEPI